MPITKKWSELSKKEQKQAKEKHGSKQGFQDAKARSQGFKNEQDRRGNSGDRHRANNTPSPSPSQPDPAKRYDKKWSELTPQQRERSGSKKEHSEVRTQHGLKGGNKGTNPSPLKVHIDVRTPLTTESGVQDSTMPQSPTYDDSDLQTRFDDLSNDYGDLKASFIDLKSNFESFMKPPAQQEQASTETTNPFTNVASSPSPFNSGINNSSVISYLNDSKGVEITPYQPTTQASYTTESTKNPTNFTGYQPQVYTPAKNYVTGDDKSVADKQQMYVSEGGQGFYGSPQVTPTNPFTGKPFELDASGLPKLPTNFMYGPGTTIPGQLKPNKGIGV